MNFELFLKIITKINVFKKMNNGSVMPNTELVIILGSKINNDAPMIAKRPETNQAIF